MVSYDASIARALSDISRQLHTIAVLLHRNNSELRQNNALFRRAYNLSYKDVEQENQDFKEEWK